jgi:predicted amidophosphoribosyltransferase
LEREKTTVAAMVRLWCRNHHHGGGLCPECGALLKYSLDRLERCPFGDDKPTCKACPVHCYQRERREEMREVMRYAGPRMLWRHPILSILHLWDGRKPEKPRRTPPS